MNPSDINEQLKYARYVGEHYIDFVEFLMDNYLQDFTFQELYDEFETLQENT